jgi:hypothetical protein
MKIKKTVLAEGQNLLEPIGCFYVISLLILLSSPLFLIWVSWQLALKVMLSGLILLIGFGILYNFITRVMKDKNYF